MYVPYVLDPMHRTLTLFELFAPPPKYKMFSPINAALNNIKHNKIALTRNYDNNKLKIEYRTLERIISKYNQNSR